MGNLADYISSGAGYLFAVLAWLINRQVGQIDAGLSKASEDHEGLQFYAHELETRIAVLESKILYK